MMIEINYKDFPEDYNLQKIFWQKNAQSIIHNYTCQSTSFLFGCQPSLAIGMPAAQVIYILTKRFGDEKVRQCLNSEYSYESPIAQNTDTEWIKASSMIGVNVRTIGSFWNLVKYALTLPASVSAIHLLPIWECGVVASLYGIASWHINTEFFDHEIATQFPNLNTVEKQLKVVVNFLHLMGKSVGFDVVPHTDRYSEIVLANPFYFEWLQRRDFKIIDHSDTLSHKVANKIVEFITANGSASGDYFPRNTAEFFNNEINNEAVRLRILFGKKENKEARNHRRNQLINFLFENGFEPVPATMAPPYRGLVVNPSENAKTVDSEGRIWRDYLIAKPQDMSRVFGPLARYKLYESKQNNLNWELDFDKPRPEVFEYVSKKYNEVCHNYNFDFMRGDMSHVQMNPQVTDNQLNDYYDIHKYVKKIIGGTKPNFGYFAESFLADDNIMAYGNEANHLDRSSTDSTLGNLQAFSLNEQAFYQEFINYYNLVKTNNFKPNFTIFTADKDDPRFDAAFVEGNAVRYFISQFFKYFPSYSSLGFEIRDIHLQPVANEYYSKLYVFQIENDAKTTTGPYRWGQNGQIFSDYQKINLLTDEVFVSNGYQFKLLSDIYKFENEKVLIWSLEFEHTQYVFLTVLSIENDYFEYKLDKVQNPEILLKKNCEVNKTNKLIMRRYSYVAIKIGLANY
jgi:hypothetical protein